MVLLERTIGCQPGSITLNQVLRVSEPLLGTVFAEPRRPVPRKLSRNGKTEEWVVFEASDDAGLGRQHSDNATVSDHLNPDPGREGRLRSPAEVCRSQHPVERQDQLRPSAKDTQTRSPSPSRGKMAVVHAPPSEVAGHASSAAEHSRSDTLRLPRSISKHTGQTGHVATPTRDHQDRAMPLTDVARSRAVEHVAENRLHSSDAKRSAQEWRRKGVVWEQNEGESSAMEAYAQDIVDETSRVDEKKPSFLRSLALRSKATVQSLQVSESGIEARGEKSGGHRATPTTAADHQGEQASPVSIEASEQDPSRQGHHKMPQGDTLRSPDGPITPRHPSRNRHLPSALPAIPPWRNAERSLPSAPLPELPVTLRLDPSLPGGEFEPSLRTAVGEGEKVRKRGFLRDLISRKKSQAPLIRDTPTWEESSAGAAEESRRLEGRGEDDPVGYESLPHGDVGQTNMYRVPVEARGINQHHKGDTDAQDAYPVEYPDIHLEHLHLPKADHTRQDEGHARDEAEQIRLRRNDSSSSRRTREHDSQGTDKEQTNATDSSMSRASGKNHSPKAQRQTLEVKVDDDDAPTQDELENEDLEASREDSDSDSSPSALHEASRSTSTRPSPTTPVPTTYLGKVFDGLPFGPDVPAVS